MREGHEGIFWGFRTSLKKEEVPLIFRTVLRVSGGFYEFKVHFREIPGRFKGVGVSFRVDKFLSEPYQELK